MEIIHKNDGKEHIACTIKYLKEFVTLHICYLQLTCFAQVLCDKWRSELYFKN